MTSLLHTSSPLNFPPYQNLPADMMSIHSVHNRLPNRSMLGYRYSIPTLVLAIIMLLAPFRRDIIAFQSVISLSTPFPTFPSSTPQCSSFSHSSSCPSSSSTSSMLAYGLIAGSSSNIGSQLRYDENRST